MMITRMSIIILGFKPLEEGQLTLNAGKEFQTGTISMKKVMIIEKANKRLVENLLWACQGEAENCDRQMMIVLQCVFVTKGAKQLFLTMTTHSRQRTNCRKQRGQCSEE